MRALSNETYRKMAAGYTRKDGWKAAALYMTTMALAFLQGYSYLTDLSVPILTSLQFVFPALDLTAVFLFLRLAKESAKTIGLTKERMWTSLAAGVLGACALNLFAAAVHLAQGQRVGVQPVLTLTVLIHAAAAVSEECVFRGYIQTRLRGWIASGFASSCVGAVLFLSVHYPVKWVVSGRLAFDILPGFHVICLVLLHFACDLTYRRTNCLWGSALLHMLYNTGSAMLMLG